MFLDTITRKPGERHGFPWTVPLIANLVQLRLTSPATFLVGENGCGQSTLLEGMAWGCEALAVGALRDRGRSHPRRSPRVPAWVLVRPQNPRLYAYVAPRRGRVRLHRPHHRRDGGPASGSTRPGCRPRRWRPTRRLIQLGQTYGEDPDSRSHGETFLHLLHARLRPRGLYFLDEPETPLSPTRVQALIRLIEGFAAAGSQFVIAIHSPMLLALPGAAILHAQAGTLVRVEWSDLEHVRVTRAFLNDPQSVLRRLRR